MTHSLTLGSLLLTDDMPEEDHGYTFSVLAEGASFGVAQGVQEVIRSLLADGDLARTTRYGNRQVSFRVQVTGPSLAALAQGEAALRREVGRGNTLTWQVPDFLTAPTVFEVIDSGMAQSFDDLDELRNRRIFEVTLTCAPFARSAEMVTVSALISGITTVVVDACDSATGWTGTRSGAPATVLATWTPGSVGLIELDSNVTSPEKWTLTRTGAIDFTSTPYLVAELKTISTKQGLRVSAMLDGTTLPILESRLMTDGLGTYRVTFDATGLGVGSSLTFSHTSLPGDAWQGLFVRQVSRSDVAPGVTPRQVSRIVEPGGTERTPCSIHVKSGAGWLGQTIVATWPERGTGFNPSMRRWRSAGNAQNADASTISGFREYIGGGAVSFLVPAASIPAGTYELVARLRRPITTGVRPVYWEAFTAIDDVLLPDKISGSRDVSFPVAGDWQIVSLGVMSLPVVAAVSGDLAFGINDPTSSDVEYDDLWLIPAGDDCSSTVVLARAPFLWLDSPSLESRVPQVWVSPTDNKADARHPGSDLTAEGDHVLTQDRTAVFVASAFADRPIVEVTYYQRWHSNAAG